MTVTDFISNVKYLYISMKKSIVKEYDFTLLAIAKLLNGDFSMKFLIIYPMYK